nr:hypothetical protein [Streptomyces spongiae]
MRDAAEDPGQALDALVADTEESSVLELGALHQGLGRTTMPSNGSDVDPAEGRQHLAPCC